MRIGSGFDVHAFCAGRPLYLCGVLIPEATGLLGYSDADVAIHALCDALFGAAALGDIGSHFPDSDAQYKGVRSTLLLSETARLVREAGFEIRNCDVTIVAQAPRIRPYVEEMRSALARCLELPVSAVSVKGTTTEGLGFTGRKEGIAALASALIEER